MGNINGSFVKQQIQNLNQVQTQQNRGTTSQVQTIGQSVFQARRQVFEQTGTKSKEITEDSIQNLESRLNQLTSKQLSNKFSSMPSVGLNRQLEEISEQESECQGEAEMATSQMPTVTPPSAPPPSLTVSQRRDQIEQGEAEMANSTRPSIVKPQVQEDQEEHEIEDLQEGFQQEQPRIEQSQANVPPVVARKVNAEETEENEGDVDTDVVNEVERGGASGALAPLHSAPRPRNSGADHDTESETESEVEIEVEQRP